MATKRRSRRSSRSGHGNAKQKSKSYEVLVGNIGTVLTTAKRTEAEGVYKDYVAASKAGVGRAGGEAVALLCDGEPIREYESESGREFD
jgi:hypothetical protein